MPGSRSIPNIFITGTPGTGKTSLVEHLLEDRDMESYTVINIGSLAKEKNLYEEFDEEYQCHVLDEDAVVNELKSRFLPSGKEPSLSSTGVILEYHSCDFIPCEWIDVVYVLRTDNSVLYDRLEERGYQDKKLQENLSCEIFQTILDEAKETFDNVIELKSDNKDDQVNNIQSICRFVKEWEEKHKEKTDFSQEENQKDCKRPKNRQKGIKD